VTRDYITVSMAKEQKRRRKPATDAAGSMINAETCAPEDEDRRSAATASAEPGCDAILKLRP